MTKEREALKLALEALDNYDGQTWEQTKEAITAIKEALAQPEQDPVAWMFQHEETGRTMCVETQQLEWGFEKGNPRLKKIAPLYTTPPQRKPLTDEQIDALREANSRGRGAGWRFNFDGFARAIEAAHGIKE